MKRVSDDDIQCKLNELKSLAQTYVDADQVLEDACEGKYDPIACTVYALKKRHVDSIPKESFDAAAALSKIVALHEELVFKFKIDPDDVRSIWFPILNKNQ